MVQTLNKNYGNLDQETWLYRTHMADEEIKPHKYLGNKGPIHSYLGQTDINQHNWKETDRN